ncbi:MAG: glucose-6-phosphate dehydrogenase [Planctomycetaceae bacterium]|mgnify:CR=1 FL=1|nr:glucose-6-phosphate dehydrogenase [Planctomycetaceae bacterium]
MAHTIVIFGASGDLTSRKLIPALYELSRKGRLPEGTRIVGTSRTEYTDESWRAELADSTAKFVGDRFSEENWQNFAPAIHYLPGDIEQADSFQRLAAYLDELEESQPATRVYYLSTAPRFYQPAAAHLGAANMAEESRAPRRIVIEKPFGTDLDSARQLNEAVHKVFAEHQVYRIDHYLGKETVSNILAFRFANTIFEPVWNRNYIDHVQITAAEEVTIGHRAGFYETAGVLRDMFQNHLMQLFTLTAMEAPARFEADSVRDEKVKVLRAVRPMREEDVVASTVRGQYRSYRDEPNVDRRSNTSTFGAVKLSVDNWRWQGVPFYLRSLKASSCRTTQIVIQFRQPPHLMFDTESVKTFEANRLILQIQPAEGIQLQFQTKVPDAGMKLRMTDLDFRFRTKFAGDLPEAYQRLLLDVMQGDASLFSRSDEVELAWGIIDPIQRVWDSSSAPPLGLYAEGDWGPVTSTAWMQQQGRQWFDLCPVLH